MDVPIPDCAPPRELTKKPTLQLSDGACDVHFHVLGPWQRFPYVSGRAFTPHDIPKEKIFAVHNYLGITRGVVVQPSLYGGDLRALIDLLESGQNKYRGVISINAVPDGKALKALHTSGVRGASITLSHQQKMPPKDLIKDVVKRLAPLGWHLDFHGDFATDHRLKFLLSLGLPIVIDHMGRYIWRIDDPKGVDQAPFQKFLEFRRHERCWVKVSCADRISKVGTPFRDVLPYARALLEAAPNRVLWGTDYPNTNHKNVPDCADLVNYIADIAPEKQTQDRLLVENPKNLYDFS